MPLIAMVPSHEIGRSIPALHLEESRDSGVRHRMLFFIICGVRRMAEEGCSPNARPSHGDTDVGKRACA